MPASQGIAHQQHVFLEKIDWGHSQKGKKRSGKKICGLKGRAGVSALLQVIRSERRWAGKPWWEGRYRECFEKNEGKGRDLSAKKTRRSSRKCIEITKRRERRGQKSGTQAGKLGRVDGA